MAGAPKGNKNAEKWTEETVLPILEGMLKALEETTYYYIGELLSLNDLYNDIWADWKDKFSEKSIVSRTIKKIEAKLEQNLVRDGLKGETNPTMTIFVLKNKYKWEDVSKREHSGQVNIPPIPKKTNPDPDA